MGLTAYAGEESITGGRMLIYMSSRSELRCSTKGKGLQLKAKMEEMNLRLE